MTDKIKEIKEKKQYSIDDLLAIMAILRSEDGCPWDREQTHESIRQNFIEEVYEVCEAIDNKDESLLREELGDVLLQVIFHSRISEENGSFDFNDVADEICRKLIIRHPHVFGETVVNSSGDVLNNWDKIKQNTKGQTSITDTLESVAKSLPALMRAQKIIKRASKGGYLLSSVLDDAPDYENEKILGEKLFELCSAAQRHGIDAERALSRICEEFIDNFN